MPEKAYVDLTRTSLHRLRSSSRQGELDAFVLERLLPLVQSLRKKVSAELG